MRAPRLNRPCRCGRLGSCAMALRAHHRCGGALAAQRKSSLEPDREADPGQSGHLSVGQAARIHPRGSCIPSRRPMVSALSGASSNGRLWSSWKQLITRITLQVNINVQVRMRPRLKRIGSDRGNAHAWPVFGGIDCGDASSRLCCAAAAHSTANLSCIRCRNGPCSERAVR